MSHHFWQGGTVHDAELARLELNIVNGGKSRHRGAFLRNEGELEDINGCSLETKNWWEPMRNDEKRFSHPVCRHPRLAYLPCVVAELATGREIMMIKITALIMIITLITLRKAKSRTKSKFHLEKSSQTKLCSRPASSSIFSELTPPLCCIKIFNIYFLKLLQSSVSYD